MESCAKISFNDPFDPPWTASAFLDLMIKGAFGWKVSTDNGDKTETLVGFIFLWDSLEALEILKLAVRPENRRMGIAKTLIAQAQGRAAKQNLPLLLEVAENNLSARNLYHRCGFREIAHRPKYYASTLAAFILKWEGPNSQKPCSA